MTQQPPNYAYLFEAKGVQRYILDSGPLRDLVGASDLVAGLAASDRDDLLEAVRAALSPDDRLAIMISRRAGGAIMAHATSRPPLERLRALWRLATGLHCPGLEMSDVLLTDAQAKRCASDVQAVKLAYESGSAVRFNTAAELPPTGHPFTAFNPRTGRLVTGFQDFKDGRVDLDVLTEAQRRHAGDLVTGDDRVAAKFLPEGQPSDPPLRFPRNLDRKEAKGDAGPVFPFRQRDDDTGDDDRRIAVIHADVSGLAQTFQNITSCAKTAEDVRTAANQIELMITQAVRAATAEWVITQADAEGVLPARPVLLGGDDVTLIARADIALCFTQRLLLEIEALTRALGERKTISGFPFEGLSACAGIAVIKAGQPFLMANALAESLCKFAKKTAKKQGQKAPYASLITFHNAQSTLRESYEDIAARELVTPSGARLTANPYQLGNKDVGAVPLATLMDMARLLNPMPGTGALITAAQLLFTDPDAAQKRWTRWRQITAADAKGKADLAALDETLGAWDAAWGAADTKDKAWGPVAGLITDALDWVDFGLNDALAAA